MILLTHERQWRGGETVVAFGMFDGVHEGHAQLMRKANELAWSTRFRRIRWRPMRRKRRRRS